MNVDADRVVFDNDVTWIAERWQKEPAPLGHSLAFEFLRVPFDYAVSHRPGARFGPDAIIRALQGYSLYNADKDIDLSAVHLRDIGTVDIVHSLSESYRNIEEAVAQISHGVTPVVLGGDHSIADPVYRGLTRRKNGTPPGMIVFDAHFDSRPPVPGKEHSGHWVYTLCDVADYSRFVQLGINAPIYARCHRRRAEEQGILVRSPYEIRRRGWHDILEEAIRHASAGQRGVYISVDIDAIDGIHAPGTSVPNPCGLLAHEIMDAVFEIARRVPVEALDINEVSPPLDRGGATVHIAARIIHEFLTGVAARQIPV